MPGWELTLYEADNVTEVGPLDPVLDGVGIEQRPSWERATHEEGDGSFALPLDAATVPTKGQVVRCQLATGEHFAFRVRAVEREPVAPDAGSGEVLVVRGTGFLADWAEGRMMPPRGAGSLPAWDERVFGWTAPEYDDSAWTDATAVAVQGWGSPYYTGRPTGWSDVEAVWIAGAGDTYENADEGPRYLRRTVTLPAVARPVVSLAGDNRVIAYLDGPELGEHDDFQDARLIELDQPITAGAHTFAMVVLNNPDDGPPGGNPTAGILSIRDGVDGPVVFRSDTDWQVLRLPATPPGMTVGHAVRLFRDENPNLADVPLGFTDTVDSAGAAWPVVPWLEFQVGQAGDAFLRGLAETRVDFAFRPDGTLDMWIKGTRPSAATLELVTARSAAGTTEPDTVNVLELSWTEVADGFERVLVRHDGGHLIRPDSPPAGARTEYVRITGDATRAIEVADAMLAAHGPDTGTANVVLDPVTEDDWPGGSWDEGSVVAVPVDAEASSTVDQRVSAVRVDVAADGLPVFSPTFGSLAVERQELLARQVAAMGQDAAAGGRAESAGPAVRLDAKPRPAGYTEVPVGGLRYPVEGEVVGPFTPGQPGRVNNFRLRVRDGTTGTVTVAVKVEGITVATLSVVGSGMDVVEGLDLVWTTEQEVELHYTEASGNGERSSVWAGVTPLRT